MESKLGCEWAQVAPDFGASTHLEGVRGRRKIALARPGELPYAKVDGEAGERGPRRCILGAFWSLAGRLLGLRLGICVEMLKTLFFCEHSIRNPGF